MTDFESASAYVDRWLVHLNAPALINSVYA